MEHWLVGFGMICAVTIATAYWSPYVSRIIAALLLTHADTLEEARDFRRRRWEQHKESLGLLSLEGRDE